MTAVRLVQARGRFMQEAVPEPDAWCHGGGDGAADRTW